MDQNSLGFRDLFTYVIPGGLYILAILAWCPDVLGKLTEQHVALVSLGFVFVAYAVGFATYWISYLIRHALPGWKEEDEALTRKLIHVMERLPAFYKGEVSRYRYLSRVCLSMSVPSVVVGISWGISLFHQNRQLSITCMVTGIIVAASLLYRAVRYNKRYLAQIRIAFCGLEQRMAANEHKKDSKGLDGLVGDRPPHG